MLPSSSQVMTVGAVVTEVVSCPVGEVDCVEMKYSICVFQKKFSRFVTLFFFAGGGYDRGGGYDDRRGGY